MRLHESETPLYKAQKQHSGALCDAELLSLFLSGPTALEKARQLLSMVGYNIAELYRLQRTDIEAAGISALAASRIMAAFELGRRKLQAREQRTVIHSSQDAFNLLSPMLSDESTEHFFVVTLNRANRVIKAHRIAEGGYTGCVVDQRVVFKIALMDKATGIILSHNHPSGQKQPSQADIDITRKARDGGKLIEIQVLDHIIIAGNEYYSFADKGMI